MAKNANLSKSIPQLPCVTNAITLTIESTMLSKCYINEGK
jgi:hypothetical protein